MVVSFEDGHLVAAFSQVIGGREPGRARTHDSYLLIPEGIRCSLFGLRESVVVVVGGESLEQAKRHCAFELASSAFILARGVAGPSQRPGDRDVLEDEIHRLLVQAAPHQRDVPVGFDFRRARVRAGRSAGPFDDGFLGNSLRIRDVGSPASDQVEVELVGDR